MLHHRFKVSASDPVPPMDALTDFYGNSYRLNVPRSHWDTVSTDIKLWQRDDTFFSLTETTPFQLFRPELSSDQAPDRLVVIVALDTEKILDIGGTMHRMRPGAVAIFDGQNSLLSNGISSGQQCWFGASYAELGLSPDQIRAPIFLDPETVQARALSTQSRLVAKAFLDEFGETSNLLKEALFQVVRSLLTDRASDINSECFRALRWRNIQAFINDNLGQRDLNAEAISERFGMSRAVVYRTFEPFGGVTAYIRERRLAHIFKMLATSGDRVRFGEVSDELGFVDSAHLSNSFRNLYGASPSALRKSFAKQAECDNPGPLMPESTVSGLLLAA